jgi:hypothetical protein
MKEREGKAVHFQAELLKSARLKEESVQALPR